MTSTATKDNERFLHLLNLDGLDKELHLHDKGIPLLEGRSFVLSSKDGVMLPLGVNYHGVQIAFSTAEIANVSEDSLTFRLTQPEDVISLQTEREILPDESYTIEKIGRTARILSKKHAKVEDTLVIRFKKRIQKER